MTVAALHQSFVYLMAEGLHKCSLHVGVTGVAKLGLRHFEQARFTLKRMHTMATGAA